MRKVFSFAVMSIAAMMLNRSVYAADTEAETEVDAEVTVETTSAIEQDGSSTITMPVMRDPRLTKTSISPNEVLVCTSHGCYAVHADKIDLNKVFVAAATNGQSVLVPYAGRLEPGQVSGALDSQRHVQLPQFVTRLIQFEDTEEIYDQPTYELRVKAEADIMVALEALKTDIAIVQERFNSLTGALS